CEQKGLALLEEPRFVAGLAKGHFRSRADQRREGDGSSVRIPDLSRLAESQSLTPGIVLHRDITSRRPIVRGNFLRRKALMISRALATVLACMAYLASNAVDAAGRSRLRRGRQPFMSQTSSGGSALWTNWRRSSGSCAINGTQRSSRRAKPISRF